MSRMETIPIVDLINLKEDGNITENPNWLTAAEKMREGLGSVGFLYLINHDIPEEVISNVVTQSQTFFALPRELKERYKKDTSSATTKVFDVTKYHGYTQIGGEKLHADGRFEIKEAFDWQPQGMNPTELPEFRSCVSRLDKECKRLLKEKLLKLLAMSLKLSDVNFFLKECNHFDDQEEYTGLYNMRLLHYPPIDGDYDEKTLRGSVRCGEHADYGFLTLLFQDDVGGLEVKTVNGEWVHAKPIPGSILVNTGNLTEFWTCGIFPGTPHRIVIPSEGDIKRTKSRFSVAFFHGPDTEALVTPMDLEKRPLESDRIAKNGKVYSKDPIKAYEYMMTLVANQYV